MDKLIEQLIQHGGLVEFVVFIIPGFIAWRTYQWRQPQGEQKATDAIVGIVAFSVLTSLLWYGVHWATWPSNVSGVALFVAQVFVTPIIIALIYQSALEFCAARNWITSPHPRAWDFVFNSLAHRKRGIGENGLFFVVTLKNGDKVAGLFTDPGFASLWPYDRDLFLGQTWELEDGKPARVVAGSIGLYVDAGNIDVIEVFDYASVVNSVTKASWSQS
ncbi:MAG TPA: DUF6338 family protein [Candidatus Limnocylindrales bacterium]|nr:DUF6338 family protein [Candidatus Limnocylindrales bacterium]